jgi:hypothetical protein
MPGKDGNRERSSLARRPHRRGLFSERAHCWTSANSNGWAIPRVVYEVEIKGRLRVRIYRGIQFVYSPVFPPLRRPARAAGVGEGSLFAPCAVVAPPSGSLAPVCFGICRFESLN